MKNMVRLRFAVRCIFVVTAIALSYALKGSITFGADTESLHKEKPAPTRVLMQAISSHTSRILDAIMNGDFNTVIKESNAVAESGETIMKSLFPEGGQVGEWLKEMGKNPGNPDEVKTVKQDFEKYVKTVVDASRNIAETSKKQNIVETYKSFDAMLKKACFTCHETFRAKWPEWPKGMQIGGG